MRKVEGSGRGLGRLLTCEESRRVGEGKASEYKLLGERNVKERREQEQNQFPEVSAAGIARTC